MDRIAPQLGFNDDAFRKLLAKDAIPLVGGAVKYKVDVERFDRFFTALSFGIVFKACREALPRNYVVSHIYHNLASGDLTLWERLLHSVIAKFYSMTPIAALNLGTVKALNSTIYSVKIFGLHDFKSSITVVHEFFGKFRVTSMLSKK